MEGPHGSSRFQSAAKRVGQGLIMERPFLLDTDVLVDFLPGHRKAVFFMNRNSKRVILSAVVVAELYAGVKGDAEKAK